MSSLFEPVDNLQADDRVVLIRGHEVLLLGEEYLWDVSKIPAMPAVSNALLVENAARRLLVIDVPAEYELSPGIEAVSLRGLLFRSEEALLSAGKAFQYLHWARSHRFCGFCGSTTISDPEKVSEPNETALVCSSCGHHFFPRISPCVIMLVTRGREILLARNARYRTGFFSCLAGFVEAGESAEETVHREIREESGLEVKNLRYFKSQSWPFPSQLMLGFYAEYKSGVIVPEEGEIEEADWFDIDDLPMVPSPKITIAGELIQHYVEMMRDGTF